MPIERTVVTPAGEPVVATAVVAAPADKGLSGKVHGTVRLPDGSAAANVGVVAAARRLRGGDLALGKAQTATDGTYAISYHAALTRIDLVVTATLGTASVTSAVIVGAGPDEVVDLVVGGAYLGPADYTRTQHAIAPVLAAETSVTSIADFTEAELAMLAAKSGVDPAELVLLRQSEALAATTSLSPALFYALGRQHVSLSFAAIVTTDPARRSDALAAAIAANQVPPATAAALQTDLAKLAQLAVTEALRAPKTPMESTLGSLLAAGGLTTDQASAAVALQVKVGGDVTAFWTQLRAANTLTAAAIDQLQNALRLNALVLGHVPLVQALHGKKLLAPADLATLEVADWQALVTTAGVPPDLVAAGVTTTDYAARIAAAVEDAVPTARVAARASHLPGAATLTQFLATNPSYDIRATTVVAFLRTNPSALAFLPTAAAQTTFTQQLKGIERIYRIAPPGARLQTMEPLLAAGVDSAYAIRTMGRATFLRRFTTALGADLAAQTWERASTAAATATTLVAQHGAMYGGPQIGVLPMRAVALQQLPDYATLFGSTDSCACGDCLSLDSPAAYLTDVLHWLDGRATTTTESALEVLLDPARRGDLGTIELSCQNTNTTLPQLDLAIELLELVVAPPATPPAYQTRGTADDLRVQPEHQNDPAYVVLAGADATRDAVYPFTLPYNLWLDEARTYLGQLGVSRADLMTVLHAGGTDAALADPAVAAESLGMSPLEWDVIAGKALTPPRVPAAFWGLADGPTWPNAVDTVATFLARALPDAARDVAYATLTDWLRCDFIQAAGDLGVWFSGAGCDTTQAQLVGLTAAHLDRIHRFARVQRRLGWSAADLDRAITVLGGGVLDEPALVKLAIVRRLTATLGSNSLAELLTWWGPLDTRRWPDRLIAGRPATIPATQDGTGLVFSRVLAPIAVDGSDQSFYDARFLSRSVGAAADPAFAITADGTKLADETQALADHAAAVAAALGITATDLGVLTPTLPSDRLTLANLSQLFRHMSLAGALGLSIPDLETLLLLSGATPFDATAPANASDLVTEAAALRAANLSLAELAFVLRGIDTRPPTLAPSDTTTGVLLLAMRDALVRVPIDQPDPTAQHQAARSIVIDKLGGGLGFDAAVIAPLLDTYVRSPLDHTTAALTVFLDPSLTAYQVVDPTTGAPVLPTPTDLPAAFATFDLLAKIALLVTRLGLVASELPWICTIGPSTGTLDVNTLPVTSSAPPAAYAGWQRLRNAVTLRNAAGGQLFDLFSAAAAAQATGNAAQIAAAYTALLAALATRTGWTTADLATVVGTPTGPSALGLSYPADWLDERGFGRVAAAMTTILRVGLAAATMAPWGTIPAAIAAQQTQADAIRQAVRARYVDAQWRAIAGPLRDAIRERQRDALVDWLCAYDTRFHSADDLYGYLLIDVSISPCQLTSRIRAAMSSVQQFVQRALLNLEPVVQLTNADISEWAWMKTYRVWQANRDIFLYPENWIDPTLRDDKTPLFVALENALAQGDITADTAEAAVLDYLYGLDELARLEVVATLHVNDDPDTGDVLHVFARTRNTPPTYYYRQRLAGTQWTPWDTLDVGIDGDHLIPVIFQGRLYIFWPQFGTATVNAGPPDVPSGFSTPTTGPTRYYQIRLAWSRLRDDAWVPRQLSTVQIGATDDDYYANQSALGQTATPTLADFANQSALGQTATPTLADFAFRAYTDTGGDLVIEPIRHRADLSLCPPYVRMARFRMSGCDGAMRLEPADPAVPMKMRIPPGTQQQFQRFASEGANTELALPDRNPSTGAYEVGGVLDTTDGFFVIVPQHIDNFVGNDILFVQDHRRTFCVAPGVRRWIRQPPSWISPDAIPLEPAQLYGALGRPTPPRPDPITSVRLPTTITASPSAALVAASGGLVSASTTALANAVGAQVAYIGDQAVTPRSSSVIVLGQTQILSSTGELLASVRTPSAPVAAAALDVLTIGGSVIMPPLTSADPVAGTVLTHADGAEYEFSAFYHPYVCRMLRQIQLFGIDGLLAPSPTGPEPSFPRQQLSDTYFPTTYAPIAVDTPYPIDEFDFSYSGAYARYNWEVFFHIPFDVACRLSTNQQFADAQRWFHYIFDPTDTTLSVLAPQRYWKLKPFFALFDGENDEAGPIADLLLLLDYSGTDPTKLAERDDLMAQIAASQSDPFDPDAIARLRIAAYAKAVVMKYIDNLIAWGDQLFAEDTLETVNEATQLYVLASQILGPRPITIAVEPPQPQTFDQLRALTIDQLGDALVEVEAYLPDVGDPGDPGVNGSAPIPLGPSLYFCVPQNDQLIADTWDRVADRLFKIRHCLDLTGQPQQLPLFDPPIDPGLLVRAAAAGVDLASALRDITAPQPIHRYVVLVQKANELCAEVRGLGQMLLSALEKQDAEALALLRADNEAKLFAAMRQIRQQQIDEANATLAGLQAARTAADLRVQYYRSRPDMNTGEKAHIALSITAMALDLVANVSNSTAFVLQGAPDIEFGVAGFGGTPNSTVKTGGTQLSSILRDVAEASRVLAGMSDRGANLAATIGGYDRRSDDWQFQGNVAEQDRNSLDQQILAAQIRVAVAQNELSNLDLQISQSQAVETQLQSKYTNQQLYTWMVGQVSSIYFQGYQLAYAVAKEAERAWQFELAQPSTSFIQFGYWDSLKKGLLAGERLGYDLRRMEVAYLDQNRREYELTAQISLRLLDPMSLEKLRTDGECFVSIPEFWFDLDSPGHYLRRLKSVAISLPCVTGPYVPVRCTLTLLSSTVRASADTTGAYPRTGTNDPRFRDDALGLQTIVTSRAQEDTGLFETNLRDERYLPFEGAGAIAQWHIQLPKQFRQFDYDTITDVVLSVRYTARDGGAALQAQAQSALLPMLANLAQGISLREEMPDLLYQLLHPPTDATGQQIAVPLTKDRFPYMVRGNTITITGIDVFLGVADLAGYKTGTPVRLELTAPGGTAQPIDLPSGTDYGGVPHGSVTFAAPAAVGTWTLAFVETENAAASATVVTTIDGHRRLAPTAIRDLILVVRYRAA